MTDYTPLAATSGGQVGDPSLVTWTHVIYALHALSILIGLTSTVTIVGAFVFGIPSIIAVIMNYARMPRVRGTYLESHFRWQIRTFWFAVLWGLVIFGASLILMVILIGFVTLPLGLAIVGIWVAYRIARGWLALREARPMYV